MKHNLFSRFLSIALVLVMVASVMPASILADDELTADASSVVSEIVESVLPEETPAAQEPAEQEPAPVAEETPAPEQTPAVEEEPAVVEETPAPTPAADETAPLTEEGDQAAAPTPEATPEVTPETTPEVTPEAEEEALVSEEQVAQWMELEDEAFQEAMAALTEEEKAFIAQQEGEAYVALAQRMEELAAQEEEPEVTEEPAQPMTFEQTVDQITVKAVAVAGALPEGTTMQVIVLGQDEEAAAVLDENNVQHDGYFALDISFFDAQGNEIEPEEGSVQVNFELAAQLLPEKVDPETLAVQHLAEDKVTGEITVETVADTTEETAGTIEVKQEEEVVAVEFEVQSFSKFVITWDDTTGDYGDEDKSVTVYYVDTNGRELTVNNVQDVKKDANGVVTLADYDVGIAGYEYKGAHLKKYDGVSVSQLRVDEREGGWLWSYTYYQLQYKDGGSWQDTDATSVYLVYEKKSDPSVPEITQNLTHDKYVEDNGDGTYDLSLTVSGAIGSLENKAKVDVIFVLDKSTSMERYMNSNDTASSYRKCRMAKAVEAIKTMTDALSSEETIDAQYALVTFGTSSSSSGKWMNASELKGSLPSSVPGNQGTNYEAGLLDAKELLTGYGVRSDAAKVVVFVSDGDPTYYVKDNGSTGGPGSGYSEEAMRQAMYAVADLHEADYFFTVGVGPQNNYQRLNYLTNFNASGAPWVATGTSLPEGMKTHNYSGTDEQELKKAFDDIKGQITQLLCTGVKVTDIFSDYAQPVMQSGTPSSLTLTIKEGETVKYGPAPSITIPETETNEPTTLTPVYQDGQVTLEFPEEYQLEAGWTYIITVQVEPTDEAYTFYQENNGYIHTGDEGTGATSAGKPGIHSNAVGSKVDYTFNGKTVSEDYAFPVIQIDPTKLNEYPVRFYLEGVDNNSPSNYAFRDNWAELDAVYTGGFVALPDANTCVDSADLVVKNGQHKAADVITGNSSVQAWLNSNGANPVGLSVNSVKEALQALVDSGRLTEEATLVSVNDTTYTVKDVLEKPEDFELVYTQVSENADVIQQHYRGNRQPDGRQLSYHVHLTVKYRPGNMSITKSFSGVDKLPENYALEVKLGTQLVDTLTLKNAQYNEQTKQYTWMLEDLNGGDYTVTEVNTDVPDMELEATFTVTQEDGTAKTTKGLSATVPVSMRQTTTVAIENKYTDANGDLKITKTFDGLDEDQIKLLEDKLTFTYSYTEDGKTVEGSKTLADMTLTNGVYEVTIEDLPANVECTVTESGYEVADYDRTGSALQQKAAIQSGKTVSVNFTNNYTWNPTGKLTISKELTGMNSSMGGDATFLFEIKALDGEYKDHVWYRAITFNAKGSLTAVIEGLPVGNYQVTELDTAGYELDGSARVQTGTIATTGGNATVSYKNKPTGNNTPGDQDYVQNNFEYDKENGQWVYTQG